MEQLQSEIAALKNRIRHLESQVTNLNIKKMSETEIENTPFDQLELKAINGDIENPSNDKIVLYFRDGKLMASFGGNEGIIQIGFG